MILKQLRKCVIVSDSFKGSLSSSQIGKIAETVIPSFFPECNVISLPVADGGEGTTDCFIKATGAETVELCVTGALGSPVTAKYAVLETLAVIEMAAAAGLPSVGDNRNPAITTTFGVGEMIEHAIDSGCTDIYLGLGGSATNDGGCGCAAALGVKFYNEAGETFIPVGGTLKDIARIDTSACRMGRTRLTIISDVTNPLYGENGAAFVFGPQKGADPAMVRELDLGLQHFSSILTRDTGTDYSMVEGAGAAGGMGAGCISLLGGVIRSGIDSMLDIIGFDKHLDHADLVITGEGRLDSQSMQGKVISGVASRTKLRDIPLIAIVGCTEDSSQAAYDAGVSAVFTTDRRAKPFPDLMLTAEQDYSDTLKDVLRLIQLILPL